MATVTPASGPGTDSRVGDSDLAEGNGGVAVATVGAQLDASPGVAVPAAVALSVIVPAYCQEATIVQDVLNIERTLLATGLDFELIVVVDGIVDDTYGRVKPLEYGHRVRVLAYGQNRGKGHAVRYGMHHASGELIAFIDAGMDLDPAGIGEFVQRQRETGADIVIGSKRHPRSRVHYPLVRRVYSAGYQAFVRVLFGLNVRDTQVGLKLFRGEVVRAIEPVLLVKRFAFDIEMLVVAHQFGHGRIVEAPIALKHGEFPSTIRVRSIFDMLWDTAAVFYRARVLRYYEHGALSNGVHLHR